MQVVWPKILSFAFQDTPILYFPLSNASEHCRNGGFLAKGVIQYGSEAGKVTEARPKFANDLEEG